MKKPTKILALLLALFMALTLFVACDKKDDEDKDSKSEKTEETAEPKETKEPEEPKEPEKTDEDEVEAVVEAFFNDFTKGNIDKLDAYFADGANVEDFLGEMDPSKVFEGAEEFGLTEEQLEGFVKDICGTISFEIDDIEVSDDEAKVDCTITAPDTDSIDMDDEVFMQFMQDEGYTMEELSQMSEEEAKEVFGEVIPKMFKWMIDDVLPTADTTSESKTLELEKDGNDWLIVK